jgi:small subunit ribosomal protein S17
MVAPQRNDREEAGVPVSLLAVPSQSMSTVMASFRTALHQMARLKSNSILSNLTVARPLTPAVVLSSTRSNTNNAFADPLRIFRTLSTSPNYHDRDFEEMSNDELEDTSTIPGWDLIHSPPRTFPRGALVGTVVSDKMQKTVNVAVDRYRVVPKIRKRLKYTRKFMAHDENEVAKMGDLVMITPCHRLSKHKHFLLREIIRPKGQL